VARSAPGFRRLICRVRAHRRARAGRRARALVAGSVLALLLVALGGCKLDPNAVKQDPFLQELVNAQQAGSAQSTAPMEMGKPFQLDNTQWTIQETQAAYTLRIGDQTLQARGMYIVVRFLFENRSDSAQPPQPDMMVLEGTSGNASRTFPPDAAATAAYAGWLGQQDFLTATLKMQVSYPLTLVFDVPRDAGGFSLKVHSYPVQNQNEPPM
jgi:hypothetical protein